MISKREADIKCTFIYNVLIISLLCTFLGCGEEEGEKESPVFARERPGFTTDRTNQAASTILFTDVTISAGIDFQHETGAFGNKWMPETMGSGGGFLDYNNDGYLDILLVNSTNWPDQPANPSATTLLFRNRGDATFEDVSERTGINLSVYGMGAAFADFDADGDTDIYITALGDNSLLRNDAGKFTDVTDRMGVAGNSDQPDSAPAWSTSAAWVDVDRDGWLDLFVANYVRWTPESDIYVTRDGKTKSYATPQGYIGESCRLYRNVEGKSFVDITKQAGVLNDEGKSLGVAISDFNNDGWQDIVVSNDTQPNFLYINQGDGTFKDLAIPAGIGYDEIGRARAGMGIDVADLSNNGQLAIAIGNFSKEPLSLYTQIGDGQLFQDRSGSSRLSRPSLLGLSFGVRFADFDLDGLQDLIIANGHIEPEINAVQQDITFAQNTQVFKNQGDSFIDVSTQAGEFFSIPIVGRGLATGDFDMDGDLDVLITTNGGMPRLLQNEANNDNARWIRIQLAGRKPNIQALGAQITVWTGGQAQSRMVQTGSSYLTQSDVTSTVFGLGEHAKADSILVRWPTTGSTVKMANLTAGSTHIIKEDQSKTVH